MKYSREKLNSFSGEKVDKSEYDSIAQELVKSVLEGKNVSLAEESFACSIIKLLRKDGTNELAFDISQVEKCKNYRFKNAYLLYFSDLNGHKQVIDPSGVISEKQKTLDVTFLENEYQIWKKLLKGETQKNNLTGYLARETEHQIKELHSYGSQSMLGSNYIKYLEKSLTLHGKYIYLTVKESFEEIGNPEINFNDGNNNFIIDSYSYVHTLFRHFAKSIKQHQIDKSYHFDQNIKFDNIPNFILELLKCYSTSNFSKSFNKQNIYFKYKGSSYAIWFRKLKKNIKGGSTAEFLRVQTLYPVENSEELEKIQKLNSEITNCNFEFFQ
ncbi:hypothetical protein [Chryseobacterium turcicum]|uniref:Uncharacterized protein n=1 Tax=Chryseobacterium turcicum TaxID=2898076 RepID=A0A9Q3V399_9FLAO|nr:hypothetical protein [Chryseobacterium turcicum]MCD1117547.1 hypothetical protein [Chryseobacterium turcicum]